MPFASAVSPSMDQESGWFSLVESIQCFNTVGCVHENIQSEEKNFKFTVFFLFGDSAPLTPYRTECVYLCIAVRYHDITWVGN